MPAIQNDMIAKLEAAKAYLVTHHNNPPTIKQLSRIVSLNEFKLKTGFKDTFGSTIHEFITEIRMQRAQKMLSENYQVNEVSAQLGYKGVSHFITSFKKFYGITPKKLMLTKIINTLLLQIGSIFYTYFADVTTLIIETDPEVLI